MKYFKSTGLKLGKLTVGGFHSVAESLEHECPGDSCFLINFLNAGIAISCVLHWTEGPAMSRL